MVSRIITGDPPLSPKIPEKRKRERSHEVRWKNAFPYHRLTLFKVRVTVKVSLSVRILLFFFCFKLTAWATILNFARIIRFPLPYFEHLLMSYAHVCVRACSS